MGLFIVFISLVRMLCIVVNMLVCVLYSMIIGLGGKSRMLNMIVSLLLISVLKRCLKIILLLDVKIKISIVEMVVWLMNIKFCVINLCVYSIVIDNVMNIIIFMVIGLELSRVCMLVFSMIFSVILMIICWVCCVCSMLVVDMYIIVEIGVKNVCGWLNMLWVRYYVRLVMIDVWVIGYSMVCNCWVIVWLL